VNGGLEDFSVSRIKAKMPWGIEVPHDSQQVMYVWFDALINYISTLGWPENEKVFGEYWPGVQVAGKDNLRQQTAMWQAMLMSAGLPNSRQVFIHGFLTVDGQKISKSLGNTINPVELAQKYGTDAVRYFLLAKIHPWEDSDFSVVKLEETYNADLANGLGNLVSRVARLAEKIGEVPVEEIKFSDVVSELKHDDYRFDEAIKIIWGWISKLDRQIENDQPWTLENDELRKVLLPVIKDLRKIGTALQPLLPETAEKILKQFTGPRIAAATPLFPRLK
jgi:methionyl-tRNA synthetase